MASNPNIIRYISETNDANFQALIRGHLYIEALLGEVIERSFRHADALDRTAATFFNKVKLVRAVDRLSEQEEELLLAINALRNKLAHRLEFSLSFEEAFALVSAAGAARVDFSDDGILDRRWCEDTYGIEGAINEVISNTFHHLIWRNEDIFSEDDIGRLIG